MTHAQKQGIVFFGAAVIMIGIIALWNTTRSRNEDLSVAMSDEFFTDLLASKAPDIAQNIENMKASAAKTFDAKILEALITTSTASTTNL